MSIGSLARIAPVALVVAACASSPMHYYTLVRAGVEDSRASGSLLSGRGPGAAVERVSIPAQVDRAELVVRRSDGGIALLEDQLWVAPLADEMMNALTLELANGWAVAGSPGIEGTARAVTIQVTVERFESAPSRYALVEATWQLHMVAGTKSLLLECRTHAYERVGNGIGALVDGQQRAIAALADQISFSVRQWADGSVPVCPAS